MSKSSLEPLKWLSLREIGGLNSTFPKSKLNRCWKRSVFSRQDLLPGLYGSIREITSWNSQDTVDHTHHGGIFNFDFSTDGSVLATACERKSILLFDPFNGKLIGHKDKAHNDCVNYVKFLDTRLFATCSDDKTVALWDVRFLKRSIRVLNGHSNWVKNIEYDTNTGLLVTSGFDGCIYTWDINSYSTDDSYCKSVFHTRGLMRTKLTPDGSKLIISTAGGYLVVVHNLDLANLESDLHGFKPNMYRLMQMSQSPVRQGYMYNHVFERKRNKVEFISDFPDHNDAEVIASLQVHPYGWSVLSRNTSADENSEWTCVHDIQELAEEENDDNQSSKSEDPDHGAAATPFPSTFPEPGSNEHSRSSSPAFILSISVEDDSSSSRSQSPSRHSNGSGHPSPRAGAETFTLHRTDQEDADSSTSDSHQRSVRARRQEQSDSADVETTPRVSFDLNHEPRRRRRRGASQENMTFIIRSDSRVAERTLLLMDQHKLSGPRPNIHENKPRLTHHIEEPNVGRGFIKELCFSNDGRLVCSPFAYGTRLLAFNSKCSELCDTVPTEPQELLEVASCMSHRHVVVTTKFSPVHCMYVSGCLNGKVSFHQPVL